MGRVLSESVSSLKKKKKHRKLLWFLILMLFFFMFLVIGVLFVSHFKPIQNSKQSVLQNQVYSWSFSA